MPGFTSVRVINFRCFRTFHIEGMSRMNLIAGPNNAGKTALLESLFLLCGLTNPVLTVNIDGMRGLTRYRLELTPDAPVPWSYLFNLSGEKRQITLTGKRGDHDDLHLELRELRPEEAPQIPMPLQTGLQGAEGPQGPQAVLSTHAPTRVLEYRHRTGARGKMDTHYLIPGAQGLVSYPPPGLLPFSAHLFGARSRTVLEEDAKRLDALERQGRSDWLLSALKVIEPRLRGLRNRYLGGVNAIHGDVGLPTEIPLIYMGEGTARLASYLLGCSQSVGGVVLIDEVENGLHYSRLADVWATLKAASREYDVQVIATTHSLECIRAAHTAAKASPPYENRVYRLDVYGDSIRPVTYTEEELDAAAAADLELR